MQLWRLSETEETEQHQPDLYLPMMVKLQMVFLTFWFLIKGKRTEFVQRKKNPEKNECFELTGATKI